MLLSQGAKPEVIPECIDERRNPIRRRSCASSSYRISLLLQIAACRLFALDGFKKSLEVSFAEAAAAFALNDLVKERRPASYGPRKDLQHVTLVIAIDKNAELLQLVQRLVNLSYTPFKPGVVGM